MYEDKYKGKVEAASIYHDLEELSYLLKGISVKTEDPSIDHNRKQMEHKLQNLKNRMVASIVEEVVSDLRQAGNLNLKTDNQDLSKEPANRVNNDITLEEASRLIEEVKKEASRMGVPVVIAVYNRAAHPVAIHCMDDSYIASYDVAINKAYTSAALKMPTSLLKKMSQPGCELYGIQHTNQGRIIIFGGGEPLIFHDKLIGAIGVSGGTEEQDTKLAEIGRNKLEEVMTW